jgi:hypothetical protein
LPRDNGPQRQKYVAHLASFLVSDGCIVDGPAFSRSALQAVLMALEMRNVLKRAAAKLDSLADQLTSVERRRIEKGMVAKMLNLKVVTPRDLSGDYLLPRARRAGASP